MNGKGIPMCVQQYEVNDERNLDEAANTVKVVVLEGLFCIKKYLLFHFMILNLFIFFLQLWRMSNGCKYHEKYTVEQCKQRLIIFFAS